MLALFSITCIFLHPQHILSKFVPLFFFPQSNGWDANEMFRYNEMKYGITSTYDSSLSMYT